MSNLMSEHDLNCDVLVAGGGSAGVPAALAAARSGVRVILCQDRPVLGGNASSEVRMHIVGADGSGYRGEALATETREGGIIEQIRLDNCVANGQRSASMMDLTLYDLCRAENNLTLMLNTAIVGAKVENGAITEATAERQATEDRFRIRAKVFIDCTGDGRLGAEAGALFREGRESKTEFDEPLAQAAPDRQRLGSSLLFTARKHDKPMPFQAPSWVRRFTEDELTLRTHATEGKTDFGFEYGYWWLEWGGHLDTIKDNETIRDHLLAAMLGAWDHVKNGPPDSPAYPDPDSHGASHWALDWFGFLPGKRESRRFVGLHTLTENDLREAKQLDDAIAYGGWPIDTHPPRGIDAPDERPAVQHKLPYLYDVPLRACVSANLSNLMFAGRNLSATHLGFASTRVMATCAVVGEGVGTAAAYAVLKNCLPTDLPADAAAMQAIQQRLLQQDAYLINRLNEDPTDLARSATITANSEQPDGPAANVVSGQTRAVHGPRGARAEHARAGTHRWMSDPAAGLPAWLELRWDEPQTVGWVQLIFDTGMHRVLALSQSDGFTARMQWGRAQAETVRDYRIEVETEKGWQMVESIEGNYQRRREHRLAEPVTTQALRITALATNGLDHARICEMRVHAATPTAFQHS